MNIHTSKCTLAFFSPLQRKKKKKKKKKCKRHPIYSINVYKCTTVQTNKSITTNLEQGLSNTTTRLFLVKLIILHLLTAHILHLFYNSYEAKKPSLRALQVNCIAFDGPTGLRQSTYIPKEKKKKVL